MTVWDTWGKSILDSYDHTRMECNIMIVWDNTWGNLILDMMWDETGGNAVQWLYGKNPMGIQLYIYKYDVQCNCMGWILWEFNYI